MFAFVAVLVIIVAILLCNDFHFEFSCHGVIIPYFLVWRKGQDSNLRDVNLLVFKTSAINHSATLPLFIVSYFLIDVEVGGVGGVDAEIG